MAHNGNCWSVDRVETLKRLWGDGLSASQIANEMGGLTRSAVLGRAFRMELPKRKTVSSIPRSRKAPRQPRQRWAPRQIIQMAPEEVLPPPDFLGIEFLKTTNKTCMYPEGEGRSMMFCGQDRKEGSSFCAGHHRMCYFRADSKKRQNFADVA